MPSNKINKNVLGESKEALKTYVDFACLATYDEDGRRNRF
jgi:hypothetical protein